MIAVLGGEEKTGKTTMALSFPKPLSYFEFDIGGFDRAIRRFKAEQQLIARKLYPTPLQAAYTNKALVSARRVLGMRELWYRFITEFAEACTSKETMSIVLDTWTQVWELCRLAFLQEKQESQLDELGALKKGEAKLREALLQVEYAEPNARMRNLMFYAKGCRKHLVLVAYDRDEYKAQVDDDGKIREIRTGKKIYAAWGETLKHADIAFWTSRKDGSCGAKVMLPGILPLEAVNTEIDNDFGAVGKLIELHK